MNNSFSMIPVLPLSHLVSKILTPKKSRKKRLAQGLLFSLNEKILRSCVTVPYGLQMACSKLHQIYSPRFSRLFVYENVQVILNQSVRNRDPDRIEPKQKSEDKQHRNPGKMGEDAKNPTGIISREGREQQASESEPWELRRINREGTVSGNTQKITFGLILSKICIRLILSKICIGLILSKICTNFYTLTPFGNIFTRNKFLVLTQLGRDLKKCHLKLKNFKFLTPEFYPNRNMRKQSAAKLHNRMSTSSLAVGSIQNGIPLISDSSFLISTRRRKMPFLIKYTLFSVMNGRGGAGWERGGDRGFG